MSTQTAEQIAGSIDTKINDLAAVRDILLGKTTVEEVIAPKPAKKTSGSKTRRRRRQKTNATRSQTASYDGAVSVTPVEPFDAEPAVRAQLSELRVKDLVEAVNASEIGVKANVKDGKAKTIDKIIRHIEKGGE